MKKNLQNNFRNDPFWKITAQISMICSLFLGSLAPTCLGLSFEVTHKDRQEFVPEVLVDSSTSTGTSTSMSMMTDLPSEVAIQNSNPLSVSKSAATSPFHGDLVTTENFNSNRNRIALHSGPPLVMGIVNEDFSVNTTGTPFPDGWMNRISGGNLPIYLASYDGRTGVMNLSGDPASVGLKQEYNEPIMLNRFSLFKITFKIVVADTWGDGWYGADSPVILKLTVQKQNGSTVQISRLFNYWHNLNSKRNPNFVLVPQNQWVTQAFTGVNFGLTEGDKLMAVEIRSSGSHLESYVDSVQLEFNQIPPVTLSLTGARSEILVGESMTVSVSATPAVDSYQWYLDGTLVPGATAPVITLGGSLSVGNHELTAKVNLGGVVTTQPFSFRVVDLALCAQLDITGPWAPSTTTHLTQSITTFTHWEWDPRYGAIPHYYPIENNTYSYGTPLQISRSNTPWDPPSQNGYTSEDRVLVEFDLSHWYQQGLNADKVAWVELLATVSGSGEIFQGYDFSISSMTALEDGRFTSAQDDFLVGATNIQTIRGLQLNATPQTLRFNITDLLQNDLTTGSAWSGILFKPEASNIPLMRLSDVRLRIYYDRPAKIFHVREGESIQAVIDQTVAGDTVFVHAGTYHQTVTLKQGVNLLGENRDTTIIDGQSRYENVILALGSNRIEGLTITGGAAYAGAPRSAVRVEGNNVVITGNNIKNNAGYAVYLRSGQNVMLDHNLFLNNYLAIQYPHAIVTGATIQNNTIVGSNIGINLLNGVTPVISNNIITGSRFASIYEFYWGRTPSRGFASVTNNVFWNNTERGSYYGNATPPSVETWTQGNISADPRFINPVQNNYHLQPGSPALGKGAFPDAMATINGTAYNQSTITQFTPYYPELIGGTGSLNRTFDGWGVMNQHSSREFSLSYDLVDNDDYVYGSVESRYFDDRQRRWIWRPINFSSGLVLAASGFSGNQLKVEVVDDQGKRAVYYLNLTALKQNYVLNFTGMGIDATQIVQIVFTADKEHMGTRGRVTVETKGIAFIPIADADTEIPGTDYNPTAITRLSGFPALSPGSGSTGGTPDGTISLNQSSSRDFSFNYILPGSDDFVFAQIANGSFDSQGIWAGTTMDLSTGVVFAVNGPAGRKINLEIVDNLGNRKIVYLLLTGTKQNYLLQTVGLNINAARVAQIIFKANQLKMGDSGTVTVETNGLYYIPVINPEIYNQNTITQLRMPGRHFPSLILGSGAATGMPDSWALVNQFSPTEFRLSYNLTDYDDHVFAEVNSRYVTSSYPNWGFAWADLSLGSALVLAVNGSAGTQLKVDVVDDQGAMASFFLDLTGAKQNYTLNFTGTSINASRVRRILFKADKAHMETRGRAIVEMKGLYFYILPVQIEGQVYNPNAITLLPGLPALSSGTGSTGGIANGTVNLIQTSSRKFSFSYTLADNDDYVFTRVGNGSFNAQGKWTGTTMDLSAGLTFAVNGSADNQLVVKMVDDLGNEGLFNLHLTGSKQNFALPANLMEIDATHVAQIFFMADQSHMDARGTVVVEMNGLFYALPGVNPLNKKSQQRLNVAAKSSSREKIKNNFSIVSG